MKLSKVLNLYTYEDVKNFVKENSAIAIDESSEYEINLIEDGFRPLNDNQMNAGSIDLLEDGEKGIVERITNSIDSFIERTVVEKNIRAPKNVDSVIKKGFPEYHKSMKENYKLSSEVKNKVFLVAQNGTKTNLPTIDVMDLGTGIHGSKFSDTILSLHSGNKTTKDKNHLIGAFGQGGSTSLSFCKATLIISKYQNIYYFTIVVRIHLKTLKNYTYFYFVKDKTVFEVENDLVNSDEKHINALLNSESGTLIRMIDMDMSLGLRQSAFTDPSKMMDYISTELFEISIPVTVIENRREFKSYGEKNLLRNIRGSKIKIHRSKNLFKREFSGSFEVKVESDVLNVDYYAILPSKEDEWASDSAAKAVYKTFNHHEKPIIFTVNGQYIDGEHFTKLKNKGLSFLNHRLIIHVKLDQLGNKKQGLFMSNRSKIKKSNYVNKLIDQVVYQASINSDILKLNTIISDKSIDRDIDIDVEGLEKELKDIYNELLTADKPKRFRPRSSVKPRPQNLDDLNDYIDELVITNAKQEFYKNETIRIILKTNANKFINKTTKINGFINDKHYSDWEVSYMNGRIQYNIQNLKPGEYNLNFISFGLGKDESDIEVTSNLYSFFVLDEKIPIEDQSKSRNLDIEIIKVKDKDYIIDISKNDSDKKILINVCLNNKLLDAIVIGKNSSEIEQMKASLINPMALYALLLDDFYEKQDLDLKNKLLLDYCKTFIKYNKQ